MSDADPEFASEEAGARKSFWEHLQDLRKALVRSAVAVGVALALCLTFTSHITAILVHPLRRMEAFQAPQATVSLEIGSTQFGPYPVTREEFPALPPGAAPHAVYRLGTVKIGSEEVLTLKLDPAAVAPDPLQVTLRNFSPGEGFFVAFHTSLYAAFAISSPFWIYFLGSFILPALNLRERRLMGPWLAWSVLLFLAGVLLTYFLLLPVALRASVQYSHLLGFSASEWRADEYINFVSKFLLGMGVGFQFPLVVLFLVKLGLVTHRQLAHYRRHVVVFSLIIGALLTTPEPITQVAMAVPLYLLYEVCIWIAWYWERKKRQRGEIAA